MKNFLLIPALLLVVSCASFQPSVYENRSTGDQTNVYATGEAATRAGSSNTSHNNPSANGNNSGGYNGAYIPRNERSYSGTERIKEDTGNTINSIFQNFLYRGANSIWQ